MSLLRYLLRQPQQLPYMIRAHYPREVRAWSLMAITLGTVEGGVMGVLVKNLYQGQVPDLWLNTAVALVTGAPSLANIISFFWVTAATGRPKVNFMLRLQAACVLTPALIVFAPINPSGLLMMVCGSLGTRIFWTGVTTLRTQVWRANYPRRIMANLVGHGMTMMLLLMGITGMIIGYAVDHFTEAFRVVFAIAIAVSLVGVWTYRRTRMRNEARILRAERSMLGARNQRAGLRSMLQVLKDDPDYRRYMRLMFQFGGGNLMVIAPLILILNDRYALSQFDQMMISSSIPLIMMTFSMHIWSRMLDHRHIIHYRARQSWVFVLAFIVWSAAMFIDHRALLWAGSILYGIGMAGGVLGWNMGHHDFATPEKANQYMGLHVSLTGVRGLLAPLIGVWIYQGIEMVAPGYGRYVILLPLLLVTSGAYGFVRMSREMRARK